MKSAAVLSCLIIAVLGSPVLAQGTGSRSYTTITGVTMTGLSNGVQIRVDADGILQFRDTDLYGKQMHIAFPDARNGTGKNFINANKYPVSFVQISTPQGAVNGIGVVMNITNFVDTSATITNTSDSEGVILTIRSDRTIDTLRQPSVASTPVVDNTNAPTTEVSIADGLMTVRAVKADIHALVAAIARKAGLQVAVDDAVNRKVSISVAGVTPDVALQSIATGYGLALDQHDGISMISEGVPTDLATYHLSGTQSFRLQNTQAQTASGLLPNFLYSYVKVNSEQNAVVVTAPSQMLAKIGQDLRKVDVPSPQILIEAVIVELTDTNELHLGLSASSQQKHSFLSLDNTAGSLIYNTIGKLPSDFEATLNSLELAGRARVRARPRMAAVNGHQATIFIGAQRFIQTQFNQYGQTQTRIQPVNVGVTLSVTPLTGGNGEITTTISPEVSNITELDIHTGLPVLSTRRTNTTVRVKDGETIAIGGLTLDQEQSTASKIPLLGDLPVVGNLFRSKSRDILRTDLVVFITPHILPALAVGSDAQAATPNAPTHASQDGKTSVDH